MRSIKGKRQIRKGMYWAEFIRSDDVIPVLFHHFDEYAIIKQQ